MRVGDENNNNEQEIGLVDNNNVHDDKVRVPEAPNWVRVYPPENELNVEGEFIARHDCRA